MNAGRDTLSISHVINGHESEISGMSCSEIIAKGFTRFNVPESDDEPAFSFNGKNIPPNFQHANDNAGINGEFLSITASF